MDAAGGKLDLANETIEALDAATRAITEVLDLERVLQLIVDRVAALANARYAALGIADANQRIGRFITTGVTTDQRAAIGHLPIGRGLLGLIIREGRAYRIPEIAAHPDSSGFPAHHPPMRSLLGVPITVSGRPVGNLYLTDKQGAAEFSAGDQRIVELFARHAGIAIENARLHERLSALRVVAERDRIGRDLHDGVIQGLYAVGLSLEEVERLVTESPAEAVTRVDAAIDAIHRSIADIREFVIGLRPSMTGAGLASGIAALADGTRLTTTLDVETRIGASAAELTAIGDEARHEVLHVVREALSNAARHARASRVEVEVTRTDEGLRLVISDNGVGFDPAALAEGGHHGLVNLRERAATAGGRLEIDSQVGRGTRIVITIPIESEGRPS